MIIIIALILAKDNYVRTNDRGRIIRIANKSKHEGITRSSVKTDRVFCWNKRKGAKEIIKKSVRLSGLGHHTFIVKKGVRISYRLLRLLNRVMVSISVFDTDGSGSSPGSTTDVVFSLTGKGPRCG